MILERQQRLTEEFVPRADLVLFVLSADRPLSDSELSFLRYIRQWRKKVVFVINKVRAATMWEGSMGVGHVARGWAGRCILEEMHAYLHVSQSRTTVLLLHANGNQSTPTFGVQPKHH